MDEVTRVIPSPVGDVVLVASSTGLRRIDFADGTHRIVARASSVHLDDAERQLGEYFSGKRSVFDLVLEPVGTAFQLATWAVLRTIPFGVTITYGEQARAMGKPSAVRAVGGANGRNPLAIVVPCHRVVGSGGRLTGYAGGVDRKAWLLAHEAHVLSL